MDEPCYRSIAKVAWMRSITREESAVRLGRGEQRALPRAMVLDCTAKSAENVDRWLSQQVPIRLRGGAEHLLEVGVDLGLGDAERSFSQRGWR